PPRLRTEGLGIADALALAASELSVDEASYLVGRTYAAMLPEDYRSTHGVFYTPPAVVHRLLDSATEAGVNWKTCRALDPACGGGAFVGPLARRMVASLKGSDRRFRPSCSNSGFAWTVMAPQGPRCTESPQP